MLFDLRHIQKQLAAAPLLSPYPYDLAVAIICDTFRLAGQRPPTLPQWQLLKDRFANLLWVEQVTMLAHLLATTSLREDSVAALSKTPEPPPMDKLERFFMDVEPLTGEMVRSNAFRQEEFLRKWVRAMGGQVKDETARESARRLDTLDYTKATYELKRAEHARKKEAEKREKALREAEQRAAEARGWRE